jgi:hypothetical protein
MGTRSPKFSADSAGIVRVTRRDRAREVFLFFAGITIVAAPWMLGSGPLVAQKLLLVGALATFVTGALVRAWSRPSPGAKAAWRAQRWMLAAGAALLGLQLVQALNPSHMVLFTGRAWQLLEVGHWRWAPTSLIAPFDGIPGDFLPYKNAWRYLLIFGVAWIYAAGLALGLVERGDAKRWVTIVGYNAAALAAVCLAHRASGAELTLWKFRDTVAFTGAPVFFYKNHNGAYLAASLAVVLGLASVAKTLGGRCAWEAVGLALWVATLAVNSRAATGCATLWWSGYAVWRWRAARELAGPTAAEADEMKRARAAAKRGGRAAEAHAGVARNKKPRPRWLMPGLVAGALLALVMLTGGGKMLARFSPAFTAPGEFLQGGGYRGLLREVGRTMWGERPLFGWGGGAYLYLFNTYQTRVPEVAAQIYREQPNLNRFYMVSADSDWVEFLVEYGALGGALLTAALLAALVAVARGDAWRQGLPFFMALGATGLALHAFYDHVLRNQALLVLFLSLLVVAVRLTSPREALAETVSHRERPQ